MSFRPDSAPRRQWLGAAVGSIAVLAAACSPTDVAGPAPTDPLLNVGDFAQVVTLCKVGPEGSSATFEVSGDPADVGSYPKGSTIVIQSTDGSNPDTGKCETVWVAGAVDDPTVGVTISEVEDPAFKVERILIITDAGSETIEEPADPTVTVDVNYASGAFVVFKNVPVEPPPPPPPPPGPCGKCEGKVSAMTLMNNGPSGFVEVFQKKRTDPIYAGFVESGATFSFVGHDKKGTMGTEISIVVDGAINTKIHTSCSQPVGPGLVSGNFEIVSAESLKGGAICPLDAPPPDGGCSKCEGKVTAMTLLNNGGPGLIEIFQKKAQEPIFSGFVDADDSFSFRGTDKNGTMGTEISIYVNGQMNTKIHTSCSQPVGPGLISGDFEVISAESRRGGAICPIDLVSEQDCDFCKDGGKPIVLTMEYTGESCAASFHTQDDGKVKCEGDTGFAPSVHIVVTDKKDLNDSKAHVFFDGTVALNGTFNIDAVAGGEDKLKSETWVFIMDDAGRILQKVGFHTSCSQPLNNRDRFGSVMLVDFDGENHI